MKSRAEIGELIPSKSEMYPLLPLVANLRPSVCEGLSVDVDSPEGTLWNMRGEQTFKSDLVSAGRAVVTRDSEKGNISAHGEGDGLHSRVFNPVERLRQFRSWTHPNHSTIMKNKIKKNKTGNF